MYNVLITLHLSIFSINTLTAACWSAAAAIKALAPVSQTCGPITLCEPLWVLFSERDMNYTKGWSNNLSQRFKLHSTDSCYYPLMLRITISSSHFRLD